MKSIDFNGKTVIVTGGSMGIGEGCVRVFYEAGANVVFCARNKSIGEKLEQELNEKSGNSRCCFVQGDVSVEGDVRNVVEIAVKKFERIDCLINNAGVHPDAERIDDVSADMFNELIQYNLTSMFMFCKYAMPYLRKTKGSIINMGSLVSRIGQPGACRYVATKGAIAGLTKALAIDEAPHGVRVNCVQPGLIETPLADKFKALAADPKARQKELEEFTQLSREGTIIETGEVCLFFASELASYLTGLEVPVSGGAELGYGLKEQYINN